MTIPHTLAVVLTFVLVVAQRFVVRDLLLGTTYQSPLTGRQKTALTSLFVLLLVEVAGLLVLLVRELETQGLL